MNRQPQDPRQAAAEWLLELREHGEDPRVIQAWRTWMQADPAHARAFERMQALWDASAQLDWSQVQAARGPGPARRPRVSRPRGRRWLALAAAACCAAVALAFHGTLPLSPGPATAPVQTVGHSTGPGQVREVLLADGSRVVLGGASRIQVAIGPDARQLALLEGSAEFSVVHDPERPFVVDARQLRTRVLGTRFRIHQRADRTVVEVAEGRVEVRRRQVDGSMADARELGLGEAIGVDSTRHWTARQPALLAPGRWTGTEMVYRDEPLSNLIADLNRYAVHPFQLAPEVDAGMPISGRWHMAADGGRIDELLSAVGLRAVAQDGVIVLHPQPGSGHG